MASLTYAIQDTGADGGILVSPLGVQKGAAKIAASEKIKVVTLNEKSTTTEYVLQFLNKVMIGVADTIGLDDSVEVTVIKS